MNCLFCQKPCSNNRIESQHYCLPCYATFFYENDILNFIELWVQIKDRKYIVRLWQESKTTELKQTNPVDPNNLQAGYFHEVVLTLDYLANVSPSNIESKVQTMLTFL